MTATPSNKTIKRLILEAVCDNDLYVIENNLGLIMKYYNLEYFYNLFNDPDSTSIYSAYINTTHAGLYQSICKSELCVMVIFIEKMQLEIDEKRKIILSLMMLNGNYTFNNMVLRVLKNHSKVPLWYNDVFVKGLISLKKILHNDAIKSKNNILLCYRDVKKIALLLNKEIDNVIKNSHWLYHIDSHMFLYKIQSYTMQTNIGISMYIKYEYATTVRKISYKGAA